MVLTIALLVCEYHATLDYHTRSLGTRGDEGMNSQTLSVTETAEALGIGKASVYRAIRQGRLAALKVGKKPRLRVPMVAVQEVLAHPEGFNGEPESVGTAPDRAGDAT